MIHIRGLRKVFPPDTLALDGVDLDIAAGEFVMVIGQSGAGKTTLLRCLNRLVEPTTGEVLLNGSRVTGAPPEALRGLRRQIGVIFQQFNLVKRASVLENVLAGRLAHVPGFPSLLGRFPHRDRDLAIVCLRMVGLEDFADRRADTLSGGEQQRVAIVRALVSKPGLMLLDEVTSALDPELVGEVLGVIRDLKAGGMTMVIATHEMGFARDVADVVCFLDGGVVLEQGPPAEILGRPQQPRTRQFLQRIVAAGRL